MKYPRDEGSAIYKEAMTENRKVQNLSDPAHSQVMALSGSKPGISPGAPKPGTGMSL